MIYQFLVFCSCVLFVSGCSWFSPKEKSAPVAYRASQSQINRVLNGDKIKQGGKLLIIPFRAGEKVEANEQLDKLSLQIVRGVAERLKDNKPYYEILSAENADEADVIIEGRVTKMEGISTLAKWLPGKDAYALSISGKMVDVQTDETLLVFNFDRQSEQAEDDYQHLGFLLGKDIGGMILSVNK